MRLTDKERQERQDQLQRTMQLLVHACSCKDPACPSNSCRKVCLCVCVCVCVCLGGGNRGVLCLLMEHCSVLHLFYPCFNELLQPAVVLSHSTLPPPLRRYGSCSSTQ